MRGQVKAFTYLLILYLIIQLIGIGYIILGLINWRTYLLGWLTGALAAIILMLILIIAFLGEEGKRIIEAILSKIL